MWFGPASTVVNSSDRVQSALQLLCHSTVRNLRAMDVWIVFLEEPVPFNSNYKSLPSFNSENDVLKSNIMKWHSQCSWLATNFKAIVFSRVCSFKIFWDPSSIMKDNGFCLDLCNWKLLVAALATKPVNIAVLLAVNFTKNYWVWNRQGDWKCTSNNGEVYLTNTNAKVTNKLELLNHCRWSE